MCDVFARTAVKGFQAQCVHHGLVQTYRLGHTAGAERSLNACTHATGHLHSNTNALLRALVELCRCCGRHKSANACYLRLVGFLLVDFSLKSPRKGALVEGHFSVSELDQVGVKVLETVASVSWTL